MAVKRLLRSKNVAVVSRKRTSGTKMLAGFIVWLNYGEPKHSEWDRSDCAAILRSPDPRKILEKMMGRAFADHLVEDGPWELVLPWAVGIPEPPREASPAAVQRLRRLLMLSVMPALLMELSTQKKTVRECACGCGKWLLAERSNQKHYGDHRKKAWQQGSTLEQKERRRTKNREAQRRLYDRTFKAIPGA